MSSGNDRPKLTVIAEIATILAVLFALLAFFGYSNWSQIIGIIRGSQKPTEGIVTAIPTSTTSGSSREQIAFTSDIDSNDDIYVAYADGSAPVNLTKNAANDYSPSWSPDGSELAFVSDRDGDLEIYVLNIVNRKLLQLTNNSEDDSVPTWSPDGRQIAFQGKRGDDWEIFVVSAGGGQPVNLSNNPDGYDTFPAWSPLGNAIAFVSNRGADKGKPQIYAMNEDGSNVRHLTKNEFCNNGPAWSPTGLQIAFVSNRTDDRCLDGNLDIYVMNADGGNQKSLTNTSEDQEGIPSWSPDGQQIAFQIIRTNEHREIYVMNSNGRSPMPLISNASNNYWPAWSPKRVR